MPAAICSHCPVMQISLNFRASINALGAGAFGRIPGVCYPETGEAVVYQGLVSETFTWLLIVDLSQYDS